MNKNRFFIFLFALILSFSLSGCAISMTDAMSSEIVRLEETIKELEGEVQDLQSEKAFLSKDIEDIKIESGTAKYVVTLNIKQSHFSLDIGDHLKDEMNDVSIQIPVDKEYYDSLEIGETIEDSFRLGSLLLKGSFGSWNITVENKEIL